MMKNNTKAKIEVMQAFEDGKDIELHNGSNTGHWSGISDPSWDWPNFIYRVKPEPESLEDRIKAQYPDYDVVMLEWTDNAAPDANFLQISTGLEEYEPHTSAQSMKDFYRYVYQHPDGDLDTNTSPTEQWDKGVTLQPKAVLFTRGEG